MFSNVVFQPDLTLAVLGDDNGNYKVLWMGFKSLLVPIKGSPI